MPGVTSDARDQARSLRRSLAASWEMASWVYLSLFGALLVWVVGCSTLVGWQPTVVLHSSRHAGSGSVVLLRAMEPAGLVRGAAVAFDGDGQLLVGRVNAAPAAGMVQVVTDTQLHEVATAAVLGAPRLKVPAVGLPVVWWRTEKQALLGVWAVLTVSAIGTVLPALKTVLPALARLRRRRPV